jgi:hypothetical protein
MAGVFLSYSRADQKTVDRLTAQLRAGGHRVWVDREGIGAGARWHEEIVKAIDTAQVAVVVLSQNSIGSEHVLTELTLAAEGKVPIIPVVIEPVVIPRSMKYHLIRLQTIDLVANWNAGMKALLGTLGPYDAAPRLDSSHQNVRLMATWLKRIQEDGGDANWVVFADKQRQVFAQFSGVINRSTLQGEVPGVTKPPLTAGQLATLRSLGWEVTSANHYRDFEARTDGERLAVAQHVMRTLVEVYDVRPDAAIAVTYQLDRVVPGVARLVPDK